MSTGKLPEILSRQIPVGDSSEGGMIQLETFIELTFICSSFSSLSSILLNLDNQFSIERFEPTGS